MSIRDYIQSRPEHFLSISELPVVEPGTTAHDAVESMNQRQTSAALVKTDPGEYHLLFLHNLAVPGLNPRATNIGEFLTSNSRLRGVQIHQTVDEALAGMTGEGPLRRVLVLDGYQPAGLLSQSEQFRYIVTTQPAVYRCQNPNCGVLYPPPPPNNCTVCGSSVA